MTIVQTVTTMDIVTQMESANVMKDFTGQLVIVQVRELSNLT